MSFVIPNEDKKEKRVYWKGRGCLYNSPPKLFNFSIQKYRHVKNNIINITMEITTSPSFLILVLG